MKTQFAIGDKVTLNNKEYTITGTVARSFILERDGKKYKATADKLIKIELQDERKASGVSVPQAPVQSEIDRRIQTAAMWRTTLVRPTNADECKDWFDTLRCELSPENISCDGECSGREVAARKARINRCWKELEAICGFSVSQY